MRQRFGAPRHNQEHGDRFFGMIAETVSIPELFAPENFGRIMGVEAPVGAVDFL